MGKRRNVPMAYPVDAPAYDEGRKSSVLDPSSLVRSQYTREAGGSSDPLGRAVDLPVRPSSSWSTRHGDFEND